MFSRSMIVSSSVRPVTVHTIKTYYVLIPLVTFAIFLGILGVVLYRYRLRLRLWWKDKGHWAEAGEQTDEQNIASLNSIWIHNFFVISPNNTNYLL